MNTYNANLYIVSAPSGAGKTSLVNALIESTCNICVSVSHTTRVRRAGETEGVHYYFVSKKEFESLIKAQAFLEYAEVFQQDYYGTTRAFVTEKLSQNIDVVLEIDWQGAQQIKKIFPEIITIFILPPSREALIERLEHRARDDENTIKQRMAQAKNEISHYHEFDYIIVNDQFEEALADLKAIVCSERLRQRAQQKKYMPLIAELLR